MLPPSTSRSVIIRPEVVEEMSAKISLWKPVLTWAHCCCSRQEHVLSNSYSNFYSGSNLVFNITMSTCMIQ